MLLVGVCRVDGLWVGAHDRTEVFGLELLMMKRRVLGLKGGVFGWHCMAA